MDFTLINSFIAVAEEGSFSTAAKHLFLSQQSLSKQIAKLEAELGTELLVRSRPLRLTQNGKLFLQTAKEMLKLKQEFEETCGTRLAGEESIHVGIEHTIARAILPRVLPRYIEAHGEVFVRISEESPEELEKAVAHEGIDLVIGSISNPPSTYKTVELCRKEQLLVVPKKLMRSLAGERYEQLRAEFSKGVDLRFFEKAPFIKQPRNSSGGRSLMSYMKYYDVNPNFVCELTNVENAFQLALSGVGALIYAKIFWDMADPALQEDYLEKIDIFPLPYLPDTDKVCAYCRFGEEGRAAELLALIAEFLRDYENGELWRET
ncbi:MAG: LysR family transcriptional regulator [Oscillospiraceae bacterium]|nr:LysR family transcriptional regulator [Oscillospiraceae bacterium]